MSGSRLRKRKATPDVSFVPYEQSDSVITKSTKMGFPIFKFDLPKPPKADPLLAAPNNSPSQSLDEPQPIATLVADGETSYCETIEYDDEEVQEEHANRLAPPTLEAYQTLQDELAKTTDTLNSKLIEVAKLNQDITNSHTKLLESEEAKQKLESELVNKNKAINVLKLKITILRALMDKRELERNERQKTNANNLKQKEDALAALQEQLKCLTNKQTTLLELIKVKDNLNTDLYKTVRDSEVVKNEYQQSLQQANFVIGQLKEKILDLEEVARSAKATRDEQGAKLVSALTTKDKYVESVIANLLSENKSLKAEKTQLLVTNAQQLLLINSLKSQLEAQNAQAGEQKTAAPLPASTAPTHDDESSDARGCTLVMDEEPEEDEEVSTTQPPGKSVYSAAVTFDFSAKNRTTNSTPTVESNSNKNGR